MTRKTAGPAFMHDGITFYGSKALREYEARKLLRQLRQFSEARNLAKVNGKNEVVAELNIKIAALRAEQAKS